jgi:DNA-binding GntR family transcriptional regulator
MFADSGASEASDERPLPLGKTARSLTDQLAERILADIMSGRLAAGERLKEMALAQEHAVSRATVREALISLSRSGYVEQIPRAGARVSLTAKDDVFHLFEIRSALMGLAARKCADDPERAREMLAGQTATVATLASDETVDPHDFSAAVVALQAMIVRCSGNPRLPPLYDHLSGISTWRLIRGQATSFLTADRRRECADDWQRIVSAIGTGDGDAADAGVRLAFVHAAAAVRDVLQSSAG